MYQFSYKKIITGILLVTFTVGSIGIPLHTTEAQERDLFEGALESAAAGAAACAAVLGLQLLIGSLGGSFTLTSVPTDDIKGNFTKHFLDCFVWHVNNVLILEVTQSIVLWIQTGFEGNPAWTRNPRRTYQQAADSAFRNVLETDLAVLCSPFAAQIQINLIRQHLEPQTLECTITQAFANAEDFADFISGDFSKGGWTAWFQLVSNPNNTLFGAKIRAEAEVARHVNQKIEETTQKLAWNNGFFGVEKCYQLPLLDPDTGEQVGTSAEQECEIITPGAVIERQLNQALGAPGRRLEIAKGVNEIISALAVYLVSDIFSGSGGLSGYHGDDFSHAYPDIPVPPIPDFGGGGRTTPFDSEPAGAPGEATCFALDGIFHKPTQGEEVKRLLLPLNQNVSYDKITVDFDVTHGGWNSEDSSAIHNLFWLARSQHRNLFGYGNLRGPGRNLAIMRHGIGQRHTSKPRITSGFAAQENVTYNISYVYDVTNDLIEMVITNAGNGNILKRLQSSPDVPGINVGNEHFIMDFGFGPNVSNVELPTYDWEYKDLVVTFSNNGEIDNTCEEPQERPAGSGGGGPEPDGGDINPPAF